MTAAEQQTETDYARRTAEATEKLVAYCRWWTVTAVVLVTIAVFALAVWHVASQ